MSKEKSRGKAIQNARVCFDCAFPIVDDQLRVCPQCKGMEIDARRSRPMKTERREVIRLPFPLNTLAFESGGTMLLSGDKGSGKTTICLQARPTRFISSEQDPEKVGATWYRINPDIQAPLITNCYNWDQLNEDLLGLEKEDVVVVDSISQLASSHESANFSRLCIERIRNAGARGIFIAQFTKDGNILGPNEIGHQVDVIGTIPKDKSGMRRLVLSKNRFGSLSSTYFTIDAEGIKEQNFEFAYSVEGPVGNYSLLLYPMTGAKYAGIFDALADRDVRIEGKACAAINCAAYIHGFALPPDHTERRKFAEDHGLEWVSPADAAEWLTSEPGSKKDF